MLCFYPDNLKFKDLIQDFLRHYSIVWQKKIHCMDFRIRNTWIQIRALPFISYKPGQFKIIVLFSYPIKYKWNHPTY